MNASIISKGNFSGDFNSAYMNEKIEINISYKHQMHKDLFKRKLSTWATLFIVNVTIAVYSVDFKSTTGLKVYVNLKFKLMLKQLVRCLDNRKILPCKGLSSSGTSFPGQ